MTEIERQILLNQIAILEALAPLAKDAFGPTSARALLHQRYRETSKLVRDHSQPGE